MSTVPVPMRSMYSARYMDAASKVRHGVDDGFGHDLLRNFVGDGDLDASASVPTHRAILLNTKSTA